MHSQRRPGSVQDPREKPLTGWDQSLLPEDFLRSGATPRGFTLVELMTAMAIVAILAAVITPMIIATAKRDKEHELRVALRQIRQALDDYKQAGDLGRIPRLPGESGYPPSLGVLVTGLRDQLDPAGRRIFFLRRLPRDPFASERLPPEETWAIRSYGAEPGAPGAGGDVFDVHSLSRGIGHNGVPYREW
jgi:general secretion pathway protein G